MKSLTSIRTVLFLSLIISFVLLCTMFALTLTIMNRGLWDSAALNNKTIAESIANQTIQYLDLPLHTVTSIGDYLISQSLTSDHEILDYIDFSARHAPFLSEVQILDEKGFVRLQWPQNRNMQGFDLSRTPYVQEVSRTGKEAWSATFLNPVSGKVSVTLAVKLNVQDAQKSGVSFTPSFLVAYLNLETLGTYLSTIPEHTGIKLIITDHMGVYIVHPDQTPVEQRIQDTVFTPLAGDSDESHGELYRTKINGIPIYALTLHIPGPDWNINVYQTEESIVRPIRNITWTLIPFALLFLGFAGVLYAILSRSFTRTLRDFISQSSAVADGQYNIRFKESRFQEFREMTASFTRMKNIIQDREKNLVSSRERFLRIFEDAAVGIFHFSINGKIIDANKRAQKCFGRDFRDAIDTNNCNIWGYTINSELRTLVEGLIGREVSEQRELTTLFKGEKGQFYARMFIKIVDDPEPDTVECFIDDITELVKSTDLLRLSEEKFRTFIEQSAEGQILVDESGSIIEWNRAQANISRIPRNSVLGKKYWDILYQALPNSRKTPEAREKLTQTITEALTTGIGDFFHNPMVTETHTPDGDTGYVVQTVFPVKTTRGFRIGTTTLDITEWKKTERELQDTTAQLSAIYQAVQTGITLISQNCSIISMNPAARVLLGINPALEIGFSLYELGEPIRTPLLDAIKQVIETENTVTFEIEMNRLWYEHSLYPLRLPGSDVKGLTIFSTNITVRKQAEIAIQTMNSELEDRVTLRTQQYLQSNRKLKYANQRLKQTLTTLKNAQTSLINSEKLAALGHLVAGIAHEINTPLGAISSSAENLIPIVQDLSIRLPEYFSQLSPFEQGLFVELMETPHIPLGGLTTREERMYRKQLRTRIPEAIDEPDRYAELLTGMGIINPGDDLLTRLFQTPNSLEICEFAQSARSAEGACRIILQASQKAAKVVFALRTYGHHEDVGTFSPVNLTETIETAITLFQNAFKHGVDLTKDLSEITIYGIGDELHQVWVNLIQNAVQAMDFSGSMTISAHEQDDAAIITVSDSGPGIPAEIIDRIFDPFFTTKKAGEGSGLGLDIVTTIIKKHGGSIEVASTPGNTVFTVRLPVSGDKHQASLLAVTEDDHPEPDNA